MREYYSAGVLQYYIQSVLRLHRSLSMIRDRAAALPIRPPYTDTSMTIRLRTTLSLTVIAITLSACAMSPGMFMGGPNSAKKSLENENLKDDAAPPGAMSTITAELIKAQQSNGPYPGDNIQHLLTGASTGYKVGPGDILNIIVWDHPELSLAGATGATSIEGANIGTGYNVSSDGRIQFPYVGALKVSGLTELQIRDRLSRQIETYITKPQITVRIQSYRNSRVYIDGEVNKPGLQAMDDVPMTLPEAINRAGGFSKEADRSSIILTRKGKETRINLSTLIKQGVNPSRIRLENGDMLRITNQDRSKVFVLGEVLRPQSLSMHDGQLTLAEALGEAGGTDPTRSNPGQIYVVRKGSQGNAEIYHLDASTPTAFVLANGFQLRPHDLVYVDPARVVRWNRVVSNLLPSYGTIVAAGINATR